MFTTSWAPRISSAVCQVNRVSTCAGRRSTRVFRAEHGVNRWFSGGFRAEHGVNRWFPGVFWAEHGVFRAEHECEPVVPACVPGGTRLRTGGSGVCSGWNTCANRRFPCADSRSANVTISIHVRGVPIRLVDDLNLSSRLWVTDPAPFSGWRRPGRGRLSGRCCGPLAPTPPGSAPSRRTGAGARGKGDACESPVPELRPRSQRQRTRGCLERCGEGRGGRRVTPATETLTL